MLSIGSIHKQNFMGTHNSMHIFTCATVIFRFGPPKQNKYYVPEANKSGDSNKNLDVLLSKLDTPSSKPIEKRSSESLDSFTIVDVEIGDKHSKTLDLFIYHN